MAPDSLRPHPHSVDLLRNRDLSSPLGPFDGKVGAYAENAGRYYFVTTNADYVPQLPSLKLPHVVYLRSDMRYGTDDPTLWPQQYTSRYPHMAAISKKGTRPDLDVMWWNPSLQDFEVGSTLIRNLGRLKSQRISDLLTPVNKLVARCTTLRKSSPTLSIPLFGELIQHILTWIEQLQTLPTTFPKMVFAVTSTQRAFLELDALFHYITVFKPRMDNYFSHPPAINAVAECVGAFTTVPSEAQLLWAARLPFWFLRPEEVFDTENILSVVPLQRPMFDLADPDAHGEGAPPALYTGNSTEHKILAIKRAAAHTPWYFDPFETTFDATETRSGSPPPAHPSVLGNPHQNPAAAAPVTIRASNNPQRGRAVHQETRFQPYPTESSSKRGKKSSGPAKTERNKFIALNDPGMPPSIRCMADALALVDQSVVPFTTNPGDRRYVLPEPALFVNPSDLRRRRFLHHWTLLSDGFMYLLTQGRPLILTGQEWRDILDGLMTKRGHPNSRAYRRSEKLENVLRPVLDDFGLGSFELLPVPNEELPQFTVQQTHQIVWKIAETSFRFEFAALDKRASQKDRLDRVKGCFAGHMLVGVPITMSQSGWASAALDERHRYVGRTASLMLDWITKTPCPNIIRRAGEDVAWSETQKKDLEIAVCRFYTQAFWEYFGRAAVIPLRLDHAVAQS